MSQSTSEDKIEPHKLNSLYISASQFILENTERITKNYTLIKKIGEGTFGMVYKAKNNISGELRAIKIINKRYLTQENEDKIKREMEIHKHLDHPNIVKLYEYYSDMDCYYLITEYIEGEDLFEEIQKKDYLSEEMAATIMKQLLSAVYYCHEKKIIHKDIKPENILFTSKIYDKPDIKVVDFGTAETFSYAVSKKVTSGTAYYIAPEVLDKKYNEECDIWSCGVILYIMLNGTPPFNGETDDKILEAIRKGKYAYKGLIWKGISKEAKDLIDKMLTYNPKDRISAKEACNHPWIKNKKYNELDPKVSSEILSDLKNFHTKQKLQQAALMYIVTQLISDEEKEKLRKTFLLLDTDLDGRVSRKELIAGYMEIYNNPKVAAEEVDIIFKNVDNDHDGYINYSEFLVASTDKERLLSKENLRKAFQVFDKNNNGNISVDEVKSILGLGRQFSEEVWQKLVNEVDENKDGKITFDEFERMMRSFI